ncbi:MAG: cupin domain-containing protein [Kineosporiaceae bacterium]
MTVGSSQDREALDDLYSLSAAQIDLMPWEPVPGSSGVHQKVLWHLGTFVQALVRYDQGATGDGEPHLAAHHHLWVVSGAATVAGRRLDAGSYMHVPPGVRHRVEDVGPEGCLMLQMHRPHAPVEAERLAGSPTEA